MVTIVLSLYSSVSSVVMSFGYADTFVSCANHKINYTATMATL
jgi:hypothetical protein